MMLWLAIGAGVIALSLLAAWLHYRYWVARFTLELDYELAERIATEDGSAIELRRLSASPDHGRAGTPILLVHGLALNHRNNDIRDDLSLGRHLARRGRDVWFLTLRSGRDDLGWAEERKASYERMVRYDVPLGVQEVLARTGASELDYVGFSMGGMLIYAAIGRTVPEAQLRKVVILGSPASIQPPLVIFGRLASWVPRWLVPTVPLRFASRMVAFMVEWMATPIHEWLYNPKNAEPGVAAVTLVNGFVNIPSALAAEFVRWAADGRAVRYGETPVTETLRAVSRPAFFVAGAADRLAPPATVALAYGAWGADVPGIEKSMRIMGVEQGAAADYGHGDLAFGRFVEHDVYEPVAEFLARDL